MSDYQTFRINVRTLLTVDKDRLGISETDGFIDKMIRQSLIEVQTYVPKYQIGHETVYGPDDLVVEGSGSVGTLPEQAKITGVSMGEVGNPCTRQPLDEYAWGCRFDLTCGGCSYSFILDPHANKFYVSPKVTDGYQVSMFYDGMKLDFAATDTVPFDEAVELVVADYVTAKIERRVNKDLPMHESYMKSYYQGLWRLLTRARDQVRVVVDPNAKCEQPICQTVAVDDTDIEFAAVGDSGESGELASNAIISDTQEVANLVKSLDPDFFIHLGDTNYPDGAAETLYDHFTKYYAPFIPNDIYAAWGEHDLGTTLDGQYGKPLLDALYKIKDINSSKLYYQFIKGQVEFFVLNSGYTDADPREPDGITSVSTQGLWLQAALLASASVWKVVILHRAPYTSDIEHTPGTTTMRWPFKTWGADIVLSGHGHNYERIQVDGFPYIVCGLGGAIKRGFGSLVPGSQVRYDDANAVLRVTANATNLTVTLVNVDGQIVDSLALKQLET